MINRLKTEKGEFITISKKLINDNRLSLKAKMVLIYLLSKPDNWQFYQTEIARNFDCGVNSVAKALEELVNKNYVIKTRIHNPKGRYVYIYDIYEQPYNEMIKEE